MKRIVLCLFAVLIAVSAVGQELTEAQKAAAQAADAASKVKDKVEEAPKPKYWKNSMSCDLGFNQTFLSNWAAGGYSTFALAAAFDGKANYARDYITWDNRLQLNYGIFWSADKQELLQKANDRIYLQSQFGCKTSDKSKWSYSAGFDFRTQFSNTLDKYYQDEQGHWQGIMKSGFLAPGYANLSLGMEWKPNEWFNANLAPVTGGFTICIDEGLRQSYGMPLNGDNMYSSALFQLGMQIKLNAQADINKVLHLETQLVFFTDYLQHPFEWNRVNWDVGISWEAAKFFKIALNTWLVYDPLITIDDIQSRVQFKEFLSINFTYTLASKNNK